MFEEIKYDRRHRLDTAVIIIVAAHLGMVGSAYAQTSTKKPAQEAI